MMGDLSNTIIDGDPFDINEGGESGGGFDPTSLSLSTQTPVAADEIITGESGGTWVRKTLAKMKEYFTGATYNVQATTDKAHMDLTEDGVVKTTLPVPMTFVGTQSEWNNLSAAEQANYRIINITDDAGQTTTSNTEVDFVSSDTTDANADSWTSVTQLTTGLSLSTLFARVSQMFKNVRFLNERVKLYEAAWTGTSSSANGVALSNSLQLPAGTYLITIIIPVSNGGLVGFTHGTSNDVRLYCNANSHNSKSGILVLTQTETVKIVSATGGAMSFSYLERGALQAMRLR